MIKHHETRIEHWAGAISRWPGHWRVALLVLAGGALCAALGFIQAWEVSTRAVEVEPGTVVRLSGDVYAMGPRGLIVTVRLKNGRVGALPNGTADVRHCRIGSTIRLNRKGSYLQIHPAGCPPPS